MEIMLANYFPNKQFFILAVILFVKTFAISQQTKSELNKVLKDYEILDIETQSLYQKCKNTEDKIEVKILGWDLVLYKNNLIGENYNVITHDHNGKIQTLKIPAPVTLRGTTSKGGKVSMTVTEKSIQGYIANGMFTFYFEPTSHFNYTENEGNVVLYNTRDIIEGQEWSCGVGEQHKVRQDMNQAAGNREPMMGCKEVQYAIASDLSMFQHYGTVEAVTNHNIAVTNDVITHYDTEFNDEIRFVIVQQNIVTNSGANICPDSTGWSGMLNCFTFNWAPTGFTVTHDLGSLWTRRNTQGTTVGIAWIGAVCSNAKYNVLKDYTTNSASKRVMVAHEIGHNFNAQHDAAGSGTIMAPSVNITDTWSQTSLNTINAYYTTIPCLGNCTPTTPFINFDQTSITTGENGTTIESTNCYNKTKTILIPVSLSRSTTSQTVVNVTVSGGSTATSGRDYNLGANTLTFPSGSLSTQNISITLIDDALEENTENIILQISVVSGPGVIGTNNICTLQINDQLDQVNQVCCSPGGIKQYGSVTTGYQFIFNGDYNDSRNRFLYTPGQLASAGLQAGYITGISVGIIEKNSTGPFNNFRLGIRQDTFTTLANKNWVETTTVFQNNVNTVNNQWNDLNFTNPFYWDGVSSLYIETCFDNTTNIGFDFVGGGTAIGGGTGQYYDMRVGTSSNCTLPNISLSYSATNLQPYFRFLTYDSVSVENTLNLTAKTIINVGQKANFYSNDQKIIASAKNLGTTNMNCLQAKVFTTGNTVASLPGGGGNYAQKTIEITAENSSPYELTLYYTQAQLSAFGINADRLNIVRSNVPFNSASSNNLTIIRPDTVISNFGKDKAYVYKASFTGTGYFSLTDKSLASATQINSGDIVLTSNTSGLVLRNVNGQFYKLGVNTSGGMTVSSDAGTAFKVVFPQKDLSFASGTSMIFRASNNNYFKLAVSNSGIISTSSVSVLPAIRIENQSGNIQLNETGSASIIRSPDNSCWRVYVNEAGQLRSVKIICP